MISNAEVSRTLKSKIPQLFMKKQVSENVRKLFERNSLSGVDFDEFEVV